MSDEAAIAAISDELDNVFEKFSIQIVSIGGKEVIEQYVPLLKYFSIPHLVLVDYDYHIDNNHNTKNRDTTSDFIILKARLEDVLTELNPSFRISEKDSVKPEAAYAIVSKEIKKDPLKVKKSAIGHLFNKAIEKVGLDIDKVWAKNI